MKSKILLSIALLSLSVNASGADLHCTTKQKNAAAFTLAQELIVPVQNVEILRYLPGPWTEAVFGNVGTDQVTVRAPNRSNRGLTVKTYAVSAEQIGDTGDCNIRGILEQ